MGGACTKPSEQQVATPMSHRDQMINHEFTPILAINHPFNVNKKYDIVSELQKEIFVNVGIKRTHAYKTTLTKEEIEKKRFEFWESRTEGYAKCWIALKKAVAATQESESIQIIAESGLKLVNKSIQITYDPEGHKYDIPIFCINEPIAFAEISKSDKFIITNFSEKTINFKLRVVGIEQNVSISCSSNLTIEQFKVLAMEQIKTTWKRFRVFLAGRELLPHHKLGNFKLETDTIVQAFVSNVE